MLWTNPTAMTTITEVFRACLNMLSSLLRTRLSPFGQSLNYQGLALFIKFTFLKGDLFALWPHAKKLIFPNLAQSIALSQGREVTWAKLSTQSWEWEAGFSRQEYAHLSVRGFIGACHENIRMFYIYFSFYPLNIIYVYVPWCTENVSIMYLYIMYK